MSTILNTHFNRNYTYESKALKEEKLKALRGSSIRIRQDKTQTRTHWENNGEYGLIIANPNIAQTVLLPQIIENNLLFILRRQYNKLLDFFIDTKETKFEIIFFGGQIYTKKDVEKYRKTLGALLEIKEQNVLKPVNFEIINPIIGEIGKAFQQRLILSHGFRVIDVQDIYNSATSSLYTIEQNLNNIEPHLL